MPRYFTFHWRQELWRPDVNREGLLIRSSGSNVFKRRGVRGGNILYIVSLIDGHLYVGGRLTVSRIVTRADAVRITGSRNLYDAKDWAINEDGTGCTPLNLRRRLAAEVTRKLIHKTGKGFFFKPGTQKLDGQATRGLQEIDERSSALLDQIIEITDRMPRRNQTLTVTNGLIHKASSQPSRSGKPVSEQLAEESEDAVADADEKRLSSSQGFLLDSELRKVLEDYAMDAAKRYFESAGYDVEDHSNNQSYDLCCRKNQDLLYVEVKGTRTNGEAIVLTAGEVEFARRHKGQTALFLVHSITVSENKQVATNGQNRLIESWDVAEGSLRPVSYLYELPSTKRA
jgi:hypothetical protein